MPRVPVRDHLGARPAAGRPAPRWPTKTVSSCPRGPHQVLGADPDVGGVGDDARDVLVPRGHRVGAGRQVQLLRAYAQADRAAGRPGTGPRAPRSRLPCDVNRHVVAGRAGDLAGEQVGLAEEVRHERRGRELVHVRRRAELLDPARVHHRDRVGHRHGLLLVVRDVHEGDADLGLDPLELDLHLPAQLEVERAERLVEQQHLRAC